MKTAIEIDAISVEIILTYAHSSAILGLHIFYMESFKCI